MFSPLSIHFSMALLSAYTFIAMISLIFKGEANTLVKYVVTVSVAGAAVIWFGVVMAEIVTIILDN